MLPLLSIVSATSCLAGILIGLLFWAVHAGVSKALFLAGEADTRDVRGSCDTRPEARNAESGCMTQGTSQLSQRSYSRESILTDCCVPSTNSSGVMGGADLLNANVVRDVLRNVSEQKLMEYETMLMYLGQCDTMLG